MYIRLSDNKKSLLGNTSRLMSYGNGLAEESEQDTGSDGGSDDSGYVRCHSVHQKVVGRIDFASYHFRYTCAVRDC